MKFMKRLAKVIVTIVLAMLAIALAPIVISFMLGYMYKMTEPIEEKKEDEEVTT